MDSYNYYIICFVDKNGTESFSQHFFKDWDAALKFIEGYVYSNRKVLNSGFIIGGKSVKYTDEEMDACIYNWMMCQEEEVME